MGEANDKKTETLRQMRQQVMEGGGEARIEKIHESGRLTARERINLFVDEGSFQETGVFVDANVFIGVDADVTNALSYVYHSPIPNSKPKPFRENSPLCETRHLPPTPRGNQHEP